MVVSGRLTVLPLWSMNSGLTGESIAMPYFLVTHTALVEADDEVAAAETVVRNLYKGKDVAFTVKFDDENIRQVVVSALQPDETETAKEESGTGSVSAGAEMSKTKPVDCGPHLTPSVDRATRLPISLYSAGGLFALGILVGMALGFL